jgi:hypothetical protein
VTGTISQHRVKYDDGTQVLEVPLLTKVVVDAPDAKPRDSGNEAQQSTAVASDASAKPLANREIDIVTFAKALGEGKADNYKGFVVRGSGVIGEAGTIGDEAHALISICGKSPDGTYTAIEEGPESHSLKGIDLSRDRLFVVKLGWQKLPPGFEGLSGIMKLCKHWKARFNGSYDEKVGTFVNGRRVTEPVPVLDWEGVESP